CRDVCRHSLGARDVALSRECAELLRRDLVLSYEVRGELDLVERPLQGLCVGVVVGAPELATSRGHEDEDVVPEHVLAPLLAVPELTRERSRWPLPRVQLREPGRRLLGG